LRPGATFHDGEPATAAAVRDIVSTELQKYLGPAFDDVQEIRASAPYELEFLLERRSTFLLDGLDVLIQRGDSPIGTGPFAVAAQGPHDTEMRANDHYHADRPRIDRIIFKSYESVRSAWADMLRGRVDMLYEIGADALESLRPSTQARIFTFQRSYAFLVILNVQHTHLQSRPFRQALNAAIDRTSLVSQGLGGHGLPADGPVWPQHWAYDQDLPRFRFQPRRVTNSTNPVRITCLLMTDSSHERMALLLQRQLRSVGVEIAFEQLPSDQFVARVQAGHFEAALADARMGPSILQQFLFWYSNGPNNWGHFSSDSVDRTLDQIRAAPDDATYRAGVAAFQRAIIDDPPAIFLAWGERLRAVSTRFEVPSQPGRDILIAPVLRLWRPAAQGRLTSPN
jgi:peptide/nickel transport system substrate-binding protein